MAHPRRPTASPPSSPATHLVVRADTTTVVVCEADPDDRWSADSTESSTTVLGLEAVGDDHYRDLTVGWAAAGQDAWLVWAVYSTGDSFHSDSGRIEWIDAYASEAEAQDCAARIRAHHARGRHDADEAYSVRIQSSAGVETTLSCPWVGYFESLDSVEVARHHVLSPQTARR